MFFTIRNHHYILCILYELRAHAYNTPRVGTQAFDMGAQKSPRRLLRASCKYLFFHILIIAQIAYTMLYKFLYKITVFYNPLLVLALLLCSNLCEALYKLR